MLRLSSSALRGAVTTLGACVLIAGCAVGPQTAPPTGEVAAPRAPGVLSAADAERARANLALGKSTKAEVASALGKAAAVVVFESGFEVWVYRIRPAQQAAKKGATEWVMLFGPTGVLAKTRLRPPLAAG